MLLEPPVLYVHERIRTKQNKIDFALSLQSCGGIQAPPPLSPSPCRRHRHPALPLLSVHDETARQAKHGHAKDAENDPEDDHDHAAGLAVLFLSSLLVVIAVLVIVVLGNVVLVNILAIIVPVLVAVALVVILVVVLVRAVIVGILRVPVVAIFLVAVRVVCDHY